MNNGDAIERAMAALEERATFTISTRKMAHAKDKTEDAQADADAWNTLAALKKII